MIWGVGSALREQAVVDPRFGFFVNHDLAGYHDQRRLQRLRSARARLSDHAGQDPERLPATEHGPKGLVYYQQIRGIH